MKLKEYLQSQLQGRVVITLPLTGKVYQRVAPIAIVNKIRAMVSQLPDDFHPDDPLPEIDYPNDNDEIARYNLRQMILIWIALYEEAKA